MLMVSGSIVHTKDYGNISVHRSSSLHEISCPRSAAMSPAVINADVDL